jgi:hypothetical protein
MSASIFVGQPGQYGYAEFDDVKKNMVKALMDEAARKKESFCRNFALMAKFAGWQWRFKEIMHEDVCYMYDSLMYTCVENINKITDDDIKGTKWHISVGTGRINVTVLYYVNQQSIQVQITADIDN